jgi:hypothetical protein
VTQEGLFPAALVSVAEDADGAGPADPVLEEILLAGLTWRRSAYAKLARCRKCEALVLFAADMGLDLMAESTVDPALLDRGLEVACLLAGRYTCELEVMRHGGGPLVYRRDRWLAPTEPNTRRRLWVPEHKCNNPVGHQLPMSMLYPFEYRLAGSQNNDNECPF